MARTDTPGARVRALRKHLGLTHDQVAARGGLRRDEISKVESGANKASTARVREGLARGLGVDPRGLGEYLDGSLAMEALLESVGGPAVPVRTVPEEVSPLVRAALLAYRHGTWEPEDVVAVIELVRSSRQLAPPATEAEAVQVMERWLRAARRLRLQGQPVTALALAWAMGPETTARDEALNAEARDELRQLGGEPPAEPVRPPRR